MANDKSSLWDDPNFFQSDPYSEERREADRSADTSDSAPTEAAPTYIPYRAFGLEESPVQLQIIDEYDVVYQPSCLHLEEPVLITPYWLGLGFNRMGFILHGQQLDALLQPLASLSVGWIHAYQPNLHMVDADATNLVVVTSITRYPIERYEALLNEMLNQHRTEMTRDER